MIQVTQFQFCAAGLIGEGTVNIYLCHDSKQLRLLSEQSKQVQAALPLLVISKTQLLHSINWKKCLTLSEIRYFKYVVIFMA